MPRIACFVQKSWQRFTWLRFRKTSFGLVSFKVVTAAIPGIQPKMDVTGRRTPEVR